MNPAHAKPHDHPGWRPRRGGGAGEARKSPGQTPTKAGEGLPWEEIVAEKRSSIADKEGLSWRKIGAAAKEKGMPAAEMTSSNTH